jgi:hypothetical protein
MKLQEPRRFGPVITHSRERSPLLSMGPMRGVFPGSFDPLTVAHLAIADAAVSRFDLDHLDLVISRSALAKDHGGHAPVEERVGAIDAVASGGRAWLHAVVTDKRLIADIAEGYDVCVLGSDKWHQLWDPAFYGGAVAERDAALARIPTLAVAVRDGVPLPRHAGVVLLDIAPEHRGVSSTAVRAGRDDWRV